MKQILYKLFKHQYLRWDEARTILQSIAQGKYSDAQVASLTTVFLMCNILVEELCGFRGALFEMCVPVDLSELAPIDIVGTGGDGKNAFNIFTIACFTVVGAGFPVAEYGNYGATSVSGASNVMEQYGVKLAGDADRLRRSMEECNIAYPHAPLFNPVPKAVALIRKVLVVRTFFNMLGPLVNPVIPRYRLLGVYNLPLLRLYTYTYQKSVTRLAVIHSLDGYDEISLTNEFKVVTCDNEKIYTLESLGFNRYGEADPDDGNTPEGVAKIFDAVMEGTATEARKNVVAVNATSAIQVICPDKPIEEYIALARESLDSDKIKETLKRFVELSRWENYRPPESMKDILSEIIANKRFEIDLQKQATLSKQLQGKLSDEIQPEYSMKQALTSLSTGVIAESRRRSPSKGWIYEDARPEQVVPEYAVSGTSAFSISTDEKLFGGSLEDVHMACPLASIPILRKDFIIDEYQLYQAKIAGADAVLPITAVLDIEKCHALAEKAHELELEVLLEICIAKELPFMNKETDMVGINNRNSGTFLTDVENSFRLTGQLPRNTVSVSESGISDPQTAKCLRNTGFRGLPIGETSIKTG